MHSGRIGKIMQQLRKQYVTQNNIYISRSAIVSNLRLYQSLIATKQVIPVLKANAYGHGIEEVASIVSNQRIPYVAVDGYFEALRVHRVSSLPVLVMGAIDPTNFGRFPLRNIAFVVQEKAVLRAIGALNRKVKIHLELETGMCRQGVQLSQLEEYLGLLREFPKIILDGVMTHLADADNPKNTAHVQEQVRRFDAAVDLMRQAGFSPQYVHIAQSAGSPKVESAVANTLRVGIGLYGISPLDTSDPYASTLKGLRPALRMTSRIVKILDVQPGDTVSYNRTYTVTKQSKIAVLPIGYYEGLPRALSNCGSVQWKGKSLPIVGRVCMNHTMVDVTGSKVSLGDTVTIIADDVGASTSVANMSSKHNLFSYGVLVGLNSSVRRGIVD